MFSLNNDEHLLSPKALRQAMAWFLDAAHSVVKDIPQPITFFQFVSFFWHHKDQYKAAVGCVILAHPARVIFNREDLYMFAQKLLEQNSDSLLFCEAVANYDDTYLQWVVST